MKVMIIVGLILAIVFALAIYSLYIVGRKVKQTEQEFIDMMAERYEMDRIRKLQDKRSRKSTPKVPRMKK